SPLIPISCAHFAQIALSKTRATLFLSVVCAHLQKQWGVYGYFYPKAGGEKHRSKDRPLQGRVTTSQRSVGRSGLWLWRLLLCGCEAKRKFQAIAGGAWRRGRSRQWRRGRRLRWLWKVCESRKFCGRIAAKRCGLRRK